MASKFLDRDSSIKYIYSNLGILFGMRFAGSTANFIICQKRKGISIRAAPIPKFLPIPILRYSPIPILPIPEIADTFADTDTDTLAQL